MLTTITVTKSVKLTFLHFCPYSCRVDRRFYTRDRIEGDLRLKNVLPAKRKRHRSNRPFSTDRFVINHRVLTHLKDFGPVNCAITVGSKHFTIVARDCAIMKTITSFRQATNCMKVRSVISSRRWRRLLAQHFGALDQQNVVRNTFFTNIVT